MLDRADVLQGLLHPGARMPLLVRPARAGMDSAGFLQANRHCIDRLLLQHGAILFRGFDIGTVERFDSVIRALADEPLAYLYRSTPRVKLGEAVYSASDYPARHAIPMHCENAYQRDWPTKVLFACAHPAQSGGETPLAELASVSQRLPVECFESFRAKGVCYLRNYHAGVDLSWQTVFQTDSRDEVGIICRRLGIEFDWVGGERLRTRHLAQGVARHHILDLPVFFNQAHLFHVSSMGSETAESLLETFGPDDLPRHALFGDLTEISLWQLAEIRAAFEAGRVYIKWQQGDLLLIDNMQVAHGREPFTGKRQILASLCDAYSKTRRA